MTVSEIEIRPIETKQEWDDFIGLPWKIYQDNPNWIPPLRIAIKDMLDVDKNPFFRHAFMHPCIAYRNGEPVGRVVGVIDDNHNRFHQEKTAFFGFFEVENNQVTTNRLFDEIAKWAKSKGMTTLRGPVNLSTNHECGLLIEGYDSAPMVMMTYNPPYYQNLLDQWGLKKSKDLLAYQVKYDAKFADVIYTHAEKLKKTADVTFRTVNMKKFDSEVEKFLDVYNDAWEANWGFVPMEPYEFRHMAKEMKMIVDPRIILIAEVRGQMAGFGLTLPDVNQLFPIGLLKLLWNLKGPGRKKINQCRVLTLGIKKAYRDLGLGALFYVEYIKRGPACGYKTGEASWILEDNIPMNRALERMCGERTKVYRIFDRALN